MPDPLFLARVPVNLAELAIYAGDRGWTRRSPKGREVDAEFDDGRALHHALSETFGKSALKPFRVMVPRGRTKGSVYSYTRAAKDTLLEAANVPSCPTLGTRVLDLTRLDVKQMPDAWAENRRLAFDLRIRPTVRIKTALPDARNPEKPYKAGAELDAFFVEAQRNHPDSRSEIIDHKQSPFGRGPSGMAQASRTREAVYLDWLTARLGDVADLDHEHSSLAQFERRRVARNGSSLEGPDAIIHGHLVIRQPDRFTEVVANGIGRHRSFGYGMLLLRPPRRI